MTKLAFVDTETTGLDPDRHEIWDLAIITADHIDIGLVNRDPSELHFEPDLTLADPMALRIAQFYERTSASKWRWNSPEIYAEAIARLLDGRHLVGAVPDFDARFLTKFLRRYGQCPTWHYHLIDVENLAAGKLGSAPPWDSEELSRQLGIEPTDRHQALADARWAMQIYDAVLGAAS